MDRRTDTGRAGHGVGALGRAGGGRRTRRRVRPDGSPRGARQPREYLLESIVHPNKQIAAGFENLLVTMKDGTVYAGLLKAEDDAQIELNSPEDGLLKLRKADIKSRDRGLSAMPEELRQVLDKQDLRNLIEFLSSLK